MTLNQERMAALKQEMASLVAAARKEHLEKMMALSDSAKEMLKDVSSFGPGWSDQARQLHDYLEGMLQTLQAISMKEDK